MCRPQQRPDLSAPPRPRCRLESRGHTGGPATSAYAPSGDPSRAQPRGARPATPALTFPQGRPRCCAAGTRAAAAGGERSSPVRRAFIPSSPEPAPPRTNPLPRRGPRVTRGPGCGTGRAREPPPPVRSVARGGRSGLRVLAWAPPQGQGARSSARASPSAGIGPYVPPHPHPRTAGTGSGRRAAPLPGTWGAGRDPPRAQRRTPSQEIESLSESCPLGFPRGKHQCQIRSPPKGTERPSEHHLGHLGTC